LLGFYNFLPYNGFSYKPRVRLAATRLLTVEDEMQFQKIDELNQEILLTKQELEERIVITREELEETLRLFLNTLVSMTVEELKNFVDAKSLETVNRIKLFTDTELTKLLNEGIATLSTRANLHTVNVIDEFFKVINSAIQFGDYVYPKT